MEGSQWSVRGDLKDPFKVKANHLWGESTPKYDVSLKPGDLSVCMFKHRRAGTEATNLSRWVDVEEIAERWELTVKEDGKSDPMGVREINRGWRHQRNCASD